MKPMHCWQKTKNAEINCRIQRGIHNRFHTLLFPSLSFPLFLGKKKIFLCDKQELVISALSLPHTPLMCVFLCYACVNKKLHVKGGLGDCCSCSHFDCSTELCCVNNCCNLSLLTFFDVRSVTWFRFVATNSSLVIRMCSLEWVCV